MLNLNDSSIIALSHIIQVSVAPVFLLTGIGSILGVLANRLGRIVDRARFLESRPELSRHLTEASAEVELLRLAERKRWVNRAITLCTLCALLVWPLPSGLGSRSTTGQPAASFSRLWEDIHEVC